jgi:hypothetical protein
MKLDPRFRGVSVVGTAIISLAQRVSSVQWTQRLSLISRRHYELFPNY